MNFKRFYDYSKKDGANTTNEILDRYDDGRKDVDISLYDSSIEMGRSSNKASHRYNRVLEDDDLTKESHFGDLRNPNRYENNNRHESTSKYNKYDNFENDIDYFLRNKTSGEKTELLIRETHKVIERLPHLNGNLNTLLSSSIDKLVKELTDLRDENNYLKGKMNTNKNSSNTEVDRLTRLNESYKVKLAKYKGLYDESVRKGVIIGGGGGDNDARQTETDLLDKINYLETRLNSIENGRLSTPLAAPMTNGSVSEGSGDSAPSGVNLEKEFMNLQQQFETFKNQQTSPTPPITVEQKFSKLKQEFDLLKETLDTQIQEETKEITMEDLKKEIIELKKSMQSRDEEQPKKRVSFSLENQPERDSVGSDMRVLKQLLSNNQEVYEQLISFLNGINTQKTIKPCTICSRREGRFHNQNHKETNRKDELKGMINELINKKSVDLNSELVKELKSIIPNLVKQVEINKFKDLIFDENMSTDELIDGDESSEGTLKENDTISILGEHEWGV